MKKLLLTLCLLFTAACIFAQTNKQVLIDGKMTTKWVNTVSSKEITYYTLEEFRKHYEEDDEYDAYDVVMNFYKGTQFIEDEYNKGDNVFKPEYEGYRNVCRLYDSKHRLLYVVGGYSGTLEKYQYDENNNLIYEYKNKVSTYYEYDASNNMIHSKTKDGFEEWKKYNSKNQLIKVTNSYGGEQTYEYNSNGKVSKIFDGGILYKEYRYDSKNNVIYYYDIENGEEEFKYDAKGNVIYRKDSWSEEWCEYDTCLRSYHMKDANGGEIWRKYNAKGNITWYKSTYGSEEWYEYTADGNMCHMKDQDGKHTWTEQIYDSKGRLIKEEVYEPI